MKTAKKIFILSIFAALPITAMAQVSPFVSAQVDAAARPCSDLAGATAGLPDEQAKAVATAALGPCYDALKTLDAFEKENSTGMSADERNYLYFVGGNVIWLTAASETMKNNGQVNLAICGQVKAAEAAWANVSVPAGSQVDIRMQSSDLRRLLVPVCNQGPTTGQ